MKEITEPIMELDTHDEGTGVPTYDLPVIHNNVRVANIELRWGGPLSVSNAITSVQRLASGDKWADELWYEDTGGVDTLIDDSTSDPDKITGSQTQYMFKLSSDAVSYASAPIITAYDDSGHGATPANECLVGSAGHTSTFIKIVGSTSVGHPAQWWGEISSANLHALETGNGVILGAAAQGLNGDQAWMDCTSSDINTNPQYFSIAASVPDDATLGANSINIMLSVKYTYT